jgi:hypothetical protein
LDAVMHGIERERQKQVREILGVTQKLEGSAISDTPNPSRPSTPPASKN